MDTIIIRPLIILTGVCMGIPTIAATSIILMCDTLDDITVNIIIQNIIAMAEKRIIQDIMVIVLDIERIHAIERKDLVDITIPEHIAMPGHITITEGTAVVEDITEEDNVNQISSTLFK